MPCIQDGRAFQKLCLLWLLAYQWLIVLEMLRYYSKLGIVVFLRSLVILQVDLKDDCISREFMPYPYACKPPYAMGMHVEAF